MVDPSDILGGGLGILGKRLIARITPSEQPIMQSLAASIATIENQQAQAIQNLINSLELDIEHSHDPEAREKALLEIADAVAEERFVEWYLEEELDVEEGESLRPYTDIEDLEKQQRKWWEMYRDAGHVEESFDEATQEEIDDLVDRHVSGKHNIDLETFRSVVEFDRGAAAQRILAGPLLRHTQIITEAADACRERRERVKALEQRVAELEQQLEDEDP
jgi:polyhydroxyalkanoate synthesis regulator phasin